MTIRSAMLRAFMGLVLGAIVLVAALSFFEFRRSLEREIANNLQFGASTVLQRVDTFLFAQLENMRVWRRLEIMQDIRVGDVDKRLAHFLSDLRAGQGSVFRMLLCADTTGRIIATSETTTGGTLDPDVADWQRVTGRDRTEVLVEPAYRLRDDALTLRTAIPDAFGAGTLGYLYALLDWNEVLALLDDAVAREQRSALLLDAEGRILAASQPLRDRLARTAGRLSGWPVPARGTLSYIHSADELGFARVLTGAAASSGYQHFPGLGWHALIVEPTRVAFRPIWRLFWTMLALALLTLAVAAWIAWRLSQRIAEPIAGLTDFTRRFRKGEQSRPAHAGSAITEVSELNQAFVEMIDALERSREQIVRAGKLAVVGEMAAIMAHEVRTPLGILRTSAQLLDRQPGLGERERELIGYITSETDRLNRLVTLLLECARPRPPQFTARDLHDLINGVVNLLAAKAEHRNVTLSTDLQATQPVIDCDGEQLTQVFLNLIINALDFVPDGGRIALQTRDEPGALRVSVMDDGPGIAPDLRPHIFDPFFSRREGGIGLGLTIVQQIVQVHHAGISVGESPWGGARFDIRFNRQPRADDRAAPERVS